MTRSPYGYGGSGRAKRQRAARRSVERLPRSAPALQDKAQPLDPPPWCGPNGERAGEDGGDGGDAGGGN